MKENACMQVGNKKIVALILCVLLAFSAWMVVNQITASSDEKFLDVQIYPRGVKLYVGETELFQLVVYNGSSPFTYRWYANKTLIGSEATVEFGFEEPCNYVILSVVVTDSVGCVGTDSVLVYDPTEILIEPHSYVTEASYVVFKDGASTYMRNGTSGEIPWSSTNSSAVFNAVSGNASAIKGSIFVRAGDYNISRNVLLKNNTAWYGEGVGTHLFLAPNRPNTNNDDAVYWKIFSGYKIYNVSISNMRFDGNYLNNNDYGGITLGIANIIIYGGQHIRIDNCWIENHRVFGLHVSGYGIPIVDVITTRCHFANNQWNQISYTAGDSGAYLNEVTDNFFSGSCGDISIAMTGADGVQVTDCVIKGNLILNMTGTQGSTQPDPAWYGIKLEGSTSCIVTNNIIKYVRIGIADDVAGFGNHTISNNAIFLKDSSIASYGLHFQTEHNTLENNKIYSPPTNNSYGILLESKANYTQIIHNRFFDVGTGWLNGARDMGFYNEWYFNDFSQCGTAIDFFGSGQIVKFNRGFVTENSGTSSNSVNGTWVTHGLAGDPTDDNIQLTMKGSNYINSTCYLIAPTVIASNSTHFQIGFYIYNAGTITAVTATDQRDIMWTCEYKP